MSFSLWMLTLDTACCFQNKKSANAYINGKVATCQACSDLTTYESSKNVVYQKQFVTETYLMTIREDKATGKKKTEPEFPKTSGHLEEYITIMIDLIHLKIPDDEIRGDAKKH